MSIKIIGHPSLASDLYVKMSQVIQEIDMLSQFCKAGDEIMGHLPRNISTMCSIFIQHGGIIYCTIIRQKKFAGKLLPLEANPRKPQKFSTMNDLHYTVYCTFC